VWCTLLKTVLPFKKGKHPPQSKLNSSLGKVSYDKRLSLCDVCMVLLINILTTTNINVLINDDDDDVSYLTIVCVCTLYINTLLIY
jgi:hypothetical protein